MSRRKFLGRSAGIGAAATVAPYLVSSQAPAAPGGKGTNDKINIGVIGCGTLAMGWHFPELFKLQDVVVTAVCDVQSDRLDKAVELCKGTARPYGDYREILRRDDIDAVAIVTPPHWHARMAVDAAEAQKDFYCEKPMTLHLGESLAVARAAKKHKVVTQVGTQIHASENYRRVVELVRSGRLGKINVARTFMVMNQGPEGIGYVPQGNPPANIDWDMWIGPYPMIPYNALITKSAYPNCSFMAHSGGWTPGMAPHVIDLPFWALDLGIPKRTFCSGGRYLVKDMGDSPDTQEVLWEYDNFTMTWWMSLINSYGFDFQGRNEIKRRLGIWFHGVNGTLSANYGTHTLMPEGDHMKATADMPVTSMPSSSGHHREWVDCIRTRQQPSCHVGYHYKLDSAIALANLSMQLKRAIHFDPQTERIIGDDEAARLAVPAYRDPWKFPAEYLKA
ncbi:MAG TPA: Gfo/Idh/MocA family oxidoreductase [Phycisphaerae bacterium]|nr:Gfo/Idh/MocA family oxidoreductase [Phycisphaerae bacterium]